MTSSPHDYDAPTTESQADASPQQHYQRDNGYGEFWPLRGAARDVDPEDDGAGRITASSQRGPATFRRKRQKISLACEECRSRKVRCDGLRPQCSACRRKHGHQHSCNYPYQPVKSASQKRIIQALQERLAHLESRLDYDRVQGDSTKRRAPTVDNSEGMDIIPTPLSADSPSNGAGGAETSPIVPSPIVPSPIVQHRAQPPITLERQHYEARRLSFHSATAASARNRDGGEKDEVSDEINDSEPSSTNAMGITQSGETPEEVTSTSTEFYGKSSATAFFSHIQGRLHNGRPHGSQPGVSSAPRRQPSRCGTPDPEQRGFSERSFQHMDDYHLPPRHVADHLLDLYWRRAHSLYPYIHWPTLMCAYERLWMSNAQIQASPQLEGVGLGGPDCSTVVFYCAINAIFALGTQFSARSAQERRSRARPFERRARHLLHLDCLDRGDISLVQALLIMAHYLQCTNLPSRCWNLAGVAYRMAQGLGLHLGLDERALTPLASEIRKRVWYGCVNLDVVLGMTYGRPCLNSRKSSVTLPTPLDEECTTPPLAGIHGDAPTASTIGFFVETCKLYKILDNILSQVYDPWKESGASKVVNDHATGTGWERQISRVIEFDAELNRFEAGVPDFLHWSNEMLGQDKGDVLRRQRNVLRTRFLHTRILLYRPLFVQLCQQQQPSPNDSATSSKRQGFRPMEGQFSSLMAERCSLSCVEAAQTLIEHVHMTSKTADTGAPWFNSYYVYYSAMVLALVGLCPQVQRQLDKSRLRRSSEQCQDFQEHMVEHDPESYRYLRTLKDISEHINVDANTDGNITAPQSNTIANERQDLLMNHITNPYLEPPVAPWLDGNMGLDLCPPVDDGDFGTGYYQNQSSLFASGNLLGGMGW